MIFNVKMYLTQKAQYVASRSLTNPLSSMTYAGVVSKNSVRISILVAALNDFDILTGDILNAFLNAETREKKDSMIGINGTLIKGKW